MPAATPTVKRIHLPTVPGGWVHRRCWRNSATSNHLTVTSAAHTAPAAQTGSSQSGQQPPGFVAAAAWASTIRGAERWVWCSCARLRLHGCMRDRGSIFVGGQMLVSATSTHDGTSADYGGTDAGGVTERSDAESCVSTRSYIHGHVHVWTVVCRHASGESEHACHRVFMNAVRESSRVRSCSMAPGGHLFMNDARIRVHTLSSDMNTFTFTVQAPR